MSSYHHLTVTFVSPPYYRLSTFQQPLDVRIPWVWSPSQLNWLSAQNAQCMIGMDQFHVALLAPYMPTAVGEDTDDTVFEANRAIHTIL